MSDLITWLAENERTDVTVVPPRVAGLGGAVVTEFVVEGTQIDPEEVTEGHEVGIAVERHAALYIDRRGRIWQIAEGPMVGGVFKVVYASDGDHPMTDGQRELFEVIEEWFALEHGVVATSGEVVEDPPAPDDDDEEDGDDGSDDDD